MNELDEINKRKVKGTRGYYITSIGKMCYKNKDGKWFYCKNVVGKPGWVWIYDNGKLIEYNQTDAAIKNYPSSKEKIAFIENGPTYKLPKRKDDLRYKEGADAGVMSKSKPLLPLKPISEIPKTIEVKAKEEFKKNMILKAQFQKLAEMGKISKRMVSRWSEPGAEELLKELRKKPKSNP